MALPKKEEKKKVGEDVDNLECLCTAEGNLKWYMHHGKE